MKIRALEIFLIEVLIYLILWLTYDYLAMLSPEQLDLTLPFPESKSLGYQFWCMTGAQESYLNILKYGEWRGFSSSLDQLETITPAANAGNSNVANANRTCSPSPRFVTRIRPHHPSVTMPV